MRVKKQMIEHIAHKLANSLLDGEWILYDGDRKELSHVLKDVILEDLSVEDRLNEEVKEIIRTHDDLLCKAETDYGRIFQMVKSKLVKERSLIL